MNLSQESDEALEQAIKNASAGSSAHTAAYAEIQRRHTARILTHVSTPHWTLTPAFIIAVLILIFAAIAAWPVIRDWLPHTSSNSAPPSANSTPGATASP